MRLTMKEAKEILEARGLTISSNRPNDPNPSIDWKGEWVGYISPSSVSMHKDLPSLGVSELSDTIALRADDADKQLSARIDLLKDSPRRHEECLRQEKVDDIRDYFNRRKKAVNKIEQFMLAEMC